MISEKIKGCPSVSEYSWAAYLKELRRGYEFCPLNKTTPSFWDPKISPIVLSSNGTTRGLWFLATQFLRPSSMVPYVNGSAKFLMSSTDP